MGTEKEAPDLVCVDDEKLVRDTLHTLCAELGFRVVCFPDGDACIEGVRKAGGRLRLAIVNYDLPGTPGAEVVRTIRRERPTCRIAVTSGYSEATVFRDLKRGEVDGFLPKPFTLRMLKELLAACLPDTSPRLIVAAGEPVRRRFYRNLLSPEFEIEEYPSVDEALRAAARTVRPVVLIDVPEAAAGEDILELRRQGIPFLVVGGRGGLPSLSEEESLPRRVTKPELLERLRKKLRSEEERHRG